MNMCSHCELFPLHISFVLGFGEKGGKQKYLKERIIDAIVNKGREDSFRLWKIN